jgi:LPXTG-site transpeptidase (sortase) family protein
MSSRAFLLILVPLIALVVATSPPILGAALRSEVTPTPTMIPPTLSPTETPTTDPFAAIPLSTPFGSGGRTASRSLPAPSLGDLPATFTPTPGPKSVPGSVSGVNQSTLPWAVTPVATSTTTYIPVPPTPFGAPPDRLTIIRLGLDAPVEPVGMVASDVAPGVVEWGVPDHRAAGWLNTSAPFGLAGNTVLDGHHNIKGEVFRDLWTLQAGDEIVLYAGPEARRYVARDVMILPEKDQPLEVRLANARHLLPTEDERLTLVTCWPYENNTHRTVVVAFPQEEVRP